MKDNSKKIDVRRACTEDAQGMLFALKKKYLKAPCSKGEKFSMLMTFV